MPRKRPIIPDYTRKSPMQDFQDECKVLFALAMFLLALVLLNVLFI